MGRLYYRNLISSSVFFGYLYQSVSIGHGLTELSLEDGPEDLARCRLILTLLASLKDLRFTSEFYDYIREFLAMFRCYLCSKYELSKEIYEMAQDVFKVSWAGLVLFCLPFTFVFRDLEMSHWNA